MEKKESKSKYSDKQQLDAWIEWKEMCAINKCGDEAQDFLKDKGNKIYKQLLYSRNIHQEGIQKGLGWAYFENYAINTKYKKETHINFGKSYKDGIFYTVSHSNDAPLHILNGTLNNMLRTIVNNIFAVDMKITNLKSKEISLETKLNEEGLTLEDLIGDKKNTPQEWNNEDTAILTEFADEISSMIFQKFSFEEKCLLIAQFSGLKRSDKFIIDFLNTNTSHITDVLNKNIPKKINNAIKQSEIQLNSAIENNTLRGMIYEKLKKICISYLNSEKDLYPLLNYIEKQNELNELNSIKEEE